jgi:hypothetical protein
MNMARKPPTAHRVAKSCRIQWYLALIARGAVGMRELLLEKIKIASSMKKPN